MSDKNERVVTFSCTLFQPVHKYFQKEQLFETPEGLLLKRRLIIAASLFVFNLSSGFAAENIPFHLSLQRFMPGPGIDGLHHRSDSHRG